MSVRFSQASDRISITSAAPDPPSGFTAVWWAYLSVDRDDNSTMLRVYTVSGDSTRLNIATDTAGTGPNVYTSGNTGGVAAGDTFTVGAWLKLAVTVTGTSATIYSATVGGTTHSATGTASGGSTATGLTFAGRSDVDSSEWFNGRIAYARIYTTVLTQTEIEAEWASATVVRTSNLWANYPLTVHTDLTDHSGNGRNLTAGSTTATTEADPPIASDLTLTDTARGMRAGSTVGEQTAAGVVLADTATGVRAGTGGGEQAAVGVAVTDTVAGSVRLADTIDTAAAGVAISDLTAGSMRLGTGTDTVGVGVALADTAPGSLGLAGTTGSVTAGLALPDNAGGIRLGTTADAIAYPLTLADQLAHAITFGGSAEAVTFLSPSARGHMDPTARRGPAMTPTSRTTASMTGG